MHIYFISIGASSRTRGNLKATPDKSKQNIGASSPRRVTIRGGGSQAGNMQERHMKSLPVHTDKFKEEILGFSSSLASSEPSKISQVTQSWERCMLRSAEKKHEM